MEKTEIYRDERLDFDIDTRRYNDTVTWLAETLPGNMRTPFEYRFDGRELFASDNSAIGRIFDDAIEQAETLPYYEKRRRSIEKDEYNDMLAMMRGDLPNTMVVVSDFPPELMHANQDVGGYNVSRKQTMLRVIIKVGSDSMMMYSQSLDRSDRKSLEAIYSHLGFVPDEGELLRQRMNLDLDSCRQELLVDELTGVYDRSLAHQFGGDWYAGIRDGRRVNTYDFVCQQQDLLSAYLSQTEAFTGGSIDYNLAAAMKLRFNGESASLPVVHKFGSPIAYMLANEEMKRAGIISQSQGDVFSGCGASVVNEIRNSATGQLDKLGYGNKSNDNDKYGSLKFKCPKPNCGYINTRPRNKLIPKCQRCKSDVSCK